MERNKNKNLDGKVIEQVNYKKEGNRVYQFFKRYFGNEEANKKYEKYLTREGCYGMSEEE